MSETDVDTLTILQKNTLFSGFTQKQLEEIVPLIREVVFEKDDFIIREDYTTTDLFILKEGEVEVVKKADDATDLIRLTTLASGDAIGETALLDNTTHSVSMRALTPCVLLAISVEGLRALSVEQSSYTHLIIKLTELIRDVQQQANEGSIYSRLINNTALQVSGRLRRSNQLTAKSLKQELEYSQMRVAMGNFIINVLMVLALYIFAFKTIDLLARSNISTTFISVPVIIMFAGAVLLIMKGSGYPMSFYGLQKNNWQIAIKEALLYTIPWLLGLLLIKWLVVNTFTIFKDLPVIDMGASLNQSPHVTIENLVIQVLIIIGYLVLTPIQELIARGALQSSFQQFLVGPNKVWWAIFISNLLFSMAHVHISLSLAAAVFIPGLFWGWLYSRHKTLLGVSVSHLIIGGWAFFVLGFQKILIF